MHSSNLNNFELTLRFNITRSEFIPNYIYFKCPEVVVILQTKRTAKGRQRCLCGNI